jgi:cell division protein FtsI (penicillin-binding protein 3)
MKMKRTQDRENKRASDVLTFFHIVFIGLAIASVINIFITQYCWEPDPEYLSYFKPKKKKLDIEPDRGAIMDHNGNLLAMSTPMYDIYMDCYVQKEAHDADPKNGKKDEEQWIGKAYALAKKLPEVLHESGKGEEYYRNLIINGRKDKRRYVSIVRNIDHDMLLELQKLPLFNEKQHKGGLIIEKRETRQYPYGDLAGRVIGYVKHNSDTNTRHIGIEGKYDYILHGKKGAEWKKITDKNALIKDVDSSIVAVEHGYDIRSTLDINIQDIADRALRKNMADEEDIEGGCVAILDVETGAIRAMVNLQKDKEGRFREIYNLAAGRASEPGSVFKTVTLTTLLEDGKVNLEDRMPTNHGRMDDMPKINPDGYITSYERKNSTSVIPVIDGFKISSNYVFRRLVKDNYGENPERFIDRLHAYNFGDAYEFDLSEYGSATPSIPDPSGKGWSIYDLVSVAIGYSARVTPLQVATFYNAIANDGKMMKPYVVESIEKDGKIIQEFEPVILNGSICSKATADTVTRALKMVTLEGTASRLKDTKCIVAGKTGTSRIHLTAEERAGSRDSYTDINGRKRHQATFVGFFPADEPKYTAIVVVYTGLISHNVYGGSIPAMTFKDIADALWAYSPQWGDKIKRRGEVPQMLADHITTGNSADTPVPELIGLGLRDAIYAIENNGYRCRHNGTGHVTSQQPAQGTILKKGETITITLQ